MPPFHLEEHPPHHNPTTLNTGRKRALLANRHYKNEGQQTPGTTDNQHNYKTVVSRTIATTHRHHRHTSNTKVTAKETTKKHNINKDAERRLSLQTSIPALYHTKAQHASKTHCNLYPNIKHTIPNKPITHQNKHHEIRSPYPMSEKGTRRDPRYQNTTQPHPSEQQPTDITKQSLIVPRTAQLKSTAKTETITKNILAYNIHNNT